MPIKTILAASLVLAGVCLATPADALSQEDLGTQAYNILKQHCERCHNAGKKEGGLIVLDYDFLTSKKRTDENDQGYLYVVAGGGDVAEPAETRKRRLEDSRLWQRAGDFKDMPPLTVKNRPSEEELGVLRRWIEAGAPRWQVSAAARPFVGELQVLRSIVNHLRDLPTKENQPFQRYFSLVSLYNNPKITDQELRYFRAALAFSINSMSREPGIVQPLALPVTSADGKPIADGLVYNIDLRSVGWHGPKVWAQVEKQYPFGILWNEETLNRLHTEIVGLLDNGGLSVQGATFPYVRVDWFVNVAIRPPIYDTLLQLPDTQAALEKELGVNAKDDFLFERMQRAAFGESEVSYVNRLVDRHVGRNTRYYYLSADFATNAGKGNLFRFPLGPKFDGNPFNDNHAFEQGGGEVVFALPNGLQGYLIVDKDGKRLAEAPVSIVRDTSEISGTTAVVNGVSCMGCHKEGIRLYEDAVRDASRFANGEAKRKLTALYVPRTNMNDLINRDKKFFMQALDETIGPHLKVGADASKSVSEFVHPVPATTQIFDRDIDVQDAAHELCLANPQNLPANVQANSELLNFGLGPLGIGRRIPRSFWISKADKKISVFQHAAVQLRLGIALNSSIND